MNRVIPERIIIVPGVILESCNSKCPHYTFHDGGGYCDEWSTCKLNPQISDIHLVKRIDGFPECCPLEKGEL